MEQQCQWLDKLNQQVNSNAFDDAVLQLTKSVEVIFSTPSIYPIYNIASKIPDKYYKKVFSKLLLGWLCFLCGDNKRLHWVLTSIEELKIEDGNERSMYYALKSITAVEESPEERIKYAELAVSVLPEGRWDTVAGNAYMTYARQLADACQYRQASKHFEQAYRIFRQINNSFLAINCFVNVCLNLYALGQFEEIIRKCNEVLVFSSSQNSPIDPYINIVKLPMGLCYYAMNKISMAIEAFNTAKAAVIKLKLVHMHGVIELYLFECFRINDDKENMMAVLESLESTFGNLQYPAIHSLMTAMKIRMALASSGSPKKEWIEELELAYEFSLKPALHYIFEVLSELALKKYSEIITEDRLIHYLERQRFEGNIPQNQSISLYLAEFFYQDGDIQTMMVHLKSACELCKQYGLVVHFADRQLECFAYIEDVEPAVARKLSITKAPGESNRDLVLPESLTSREIEILQLIASGKSNKEISEALFISIGTAKWHINNIFGKLQVKKRFKAIERARQLKLI